MALKVGELFATLNLATGGFDKGLGEASQAFKKFGLLAVDVLGSFMKDSVEAGMNFDAAMSQLASTMGKSVDELDELRAKALEMGSTTKFTASEAAEGLNILAQAGLNAQEQIAGIGTVLDLASAGAISMDTSATYLSATVKGFGDSMENSSKYADIMAKGATLANTSVNDLGAAMSGVAASANAYGQTVETTALALLRMAEQNITAGEAATGLKRAMQVIYAPTGTAAKAMQQLGVSAYDAQGHARDFNTVIGELDTAMKALNNDAKKNALASDIFGARGLTVFNALVSSSEEKIASFTKGIAEATGSAASQAATQLDNLQGDIRIFDSAVEGLQIAVTKSSTGMIRDAVKGATGVVDAFHAAFEQGLTPESLQGVFSAMGDVLQNVGSQLGDMILNGMEALSGLVPSIVDNISGMLKKAVKGIQKLLPNIIKNVISAIPSLLGGLVEIAPELASALFEAAGAAVEELIGMLPELIPQLLKGVATIIPKLGEGVMRLFQGVFDGINNLMLDIGLRGMNVEEILDEKFSEVDTDKLTELSGKVPVTYAFDPVTIDVEAYTTAVTTAISEIETAIKGLSVDEDTQKALKEALWQGSGADALTATLTALGINPEKAKEISNQLEESLNIIGDTLGGYDFKDWQIDQITETLKKGGNLPDLLVSFGLDPKVAEEVAGKITEAYNAIGGALGNISLDATQMDELFKVVARGNVIENLLETFGLDPTTAAEVAQKIRDSGGDVAGALADFEGLNLNPEQMNALIKVCARGNTIQSLLEGFGLDPKTAEKVAKAIEDSGGDVDTALENFGDLGLDPSQLDALKDVANRGPEIQTALQSFGLSETDAKAVADAIEACGGDINKALDGLNIDLGPVMRFYLNSGTQAALFAAALAGLDVPEETINKVIENYEKIAGSFGPKIKSAFDALKAGLTNGIPDKDDEEFEAAKQKIHDFWDEAQAVVDEWEAAQIQGLKDSGLTGTELDDAIAGIQAQAAAAKQSLSDLAAETDTWVEENAGASAKTVQEHFDQLDAIMQKVLGVNAMIDSTTAKMTSLGSANRKAVQQGLLGDTDSQLEAINYTKQELDNTLKNLQTETANKLEQAGKDYGDDVEKFAEEKQKILAEQAQREAEAYGKYDDEMAAINKGMLMTVDGYDEAVKKIRDVSESNVPADKLMKGLSDLVSDTSAWIGKANFDPTQWLAQNAGMTEADYQNIAKSLGISPEELNAALVDMFKNSREGNVGLNWESMLLGGDLANLADGADAKLAEAYKGLDLSQYNAVLQAAIDQGLVVDGLDVDWTKMGEAGRTGLEQAGLYAGQGYGEGVAQADMSSYGDSMVTNMENAVNSAQSSNSPAEAFKPIGQYAAQGYGEGAAGTLMSTYGTQLVNNLKTAVQTAAAGAGLTEAGAAIAASLREGMEGTDFSGLSGILSSALSGVGNGLSLEDQGSKIGKSMTDGLKDGITDGKSQVIKAAAEVAKAAIREAKNILEIHSPSRVFAEMGMMNDEGLAKGMLGGIRMVSRSASEVAQASADAMSFKPNNGFGRLAAMSAGYNNNQNSIDYDRLADAVASRPAYFDVNGKRMATATVVDNSEALTARNKRILAGVGSV